jgi:hypothetical protein
MLQQLIPPPTIEQLRKELFRVGLIKGEQEAPKEKSDELEH